MAEQQHQLPNVRMYKCPTNTSRQTRSSFSKIFRKASQKINFLLFFLSQSPFNGCYYHLTNYSSLDTPTYTKFVLSQPNEILRLWSSWTKGVLVWRKMRYTITSWMGRTRSRYALIFRYTFSTLISIFRLRSRGSRLCLYIFFSFL